MAKFLYRLGVAAARRAWLVIAAWLVVLAAAGGAFAAFSGTLSSTFEIPGTPTEAVNDQLREELGTTSASGTLVVEAESGELTQEQQAGISAALAEAADIEGVDSVVDPFQTTAVQLAQAQDLQSQAQENEANTAAAQEGVEQLTASLEGAQAQGAPQAQLDELQAQLEETQGNLGALQLQAEQLGYGQQLAELAADIRLISEDGTTAQLAVTFESTNLQIPQEAAEQVRTTLDDAMPDGVTVYYSSELTQSVEGLVGPAEIVGLAVAAIVLLLMFRAVRPAALPILSSLVGVGVGVAGTLALSGTVQMTSVTPILGLMLGLAVGIDYALFIVNRHRRQLRRGMDVHESIGLANGTAGNAVVFAGSTVLVALLALNVSGIGFLGLVGTVAAVCVLVAVLVAVTLTPAMLGLLGRNALSHADRKADPISVEDEDRPEMRTRTAVLGTVVSIAVLGTIALPALDMRLGFPDGSSEPADSTQYQAYTTTAEKFGAGQNGPLLVTADLPEPVTELTALPTQVEIGQAITDLGDVVAVAPVGVSDDGGFIAFQVIPADGRSSESTEDLVHAIRDASPLDGGIELGVAGAASGSIDISDRLSDALPVYLGVVVGLSFLILVLVFRSLAVPLLATAGFVLSLVAALGAMTAVYQWGWLGSVFAVTQPGPLLNFAPLLITGVLFGLAMDYQLFLGSGIREAYVHGAAARKAITAGVVQSRAVVIAAATIMISVFGGFVFSHLAMIRPIGFGLAVGVLFDAFVVRLVLVPSMLHLLGNGAWWIPRWLDRMLPNVDVEGAALTGVAGPTTTPESTQGPQDGDDEHGRHAAAARVDAESASGSHDGRHLKDD